MKQVMKQVTAEEIAVLVGRQLGTASVRPEHLLIEELGAESIDLVNILAALADRYGINLDETELAGVDTVADLHQLVSSRL